MYTIADTAGYLHALDTSTGATIWDVFVDAFPQFRQRGPVLRCARKSRERGFVVCGWGGPVWFPTLCMNREPWAVHFWRFT